LGTRQENASLEANGIHNATKVSTIGSAKIKLRQAQPQLDSSARVSRLQEPVTFAY
jgi:hypothetical protein